MLGFLILAACAASALSLLTWQISDPSLTHAASVSVSNALGPVGAIVSDLIMQLLGLAGVFLFLPPVFWALQLIGTGRLQSARVKLMLAPVAVLLIACAASSLPRIEGWTLPYNIGGLLGDLLLRAVTGVLAMIRPERASAAAGLFCFAGGAMLLMTSMGLSKRDLKLIFQRQRGASLKFVTRAWQSLREATEHATITRREPTLRMPPQPRAAGFRPAVQPAPAPALPVDPPRSYAGEAGPVLSGPAVDGDLDPENLDRILSICAPKRAGKSSMASESPGILLQPDAEPDYAERDPVRSAPKDASSGAFDGMRGRGTGEQHGSFYDNAGARHEWPAPEPVAPRAPMYPPANGWRPGSFPGGDDLYGRAVAIVLDDRKASADYLQQRLAIGYMRAADLIDRMEREGILGAQVYNGLRPILIGSSGSREV